MHFGNKELHHTERFGWLRTRGVRIHSFRDLIKAKTRPSSARTDFWRGTNMLISNRH
jgi:hypothetical protein